MNRRLTALVEREADGYVAPNYELHHMIGSTSVGSGCGPGPDTRN